MVEARVTGSNKGGLELELVGGIKAFMPASQVDVRPVADLSEWVGKQVEARVGELDNKRKKVLLSRRGFLEEKRKRDRMKVLATLKEGEVRDGVVTSLVDFGAFVDLGGLDGLVHITDLSYTRVEKPSDVVKEGDQVRVKVLKIEPQRDRVALGLKQAAPNPWQNAEGRYQPGQEVTGKVTRIADFGAFVELEEGLDALLPISEMSWRRINAAKDVVQEGQSLRLKVLNIEPKRRRMTLSLKQLEGDPWQEADDKYAPGTRHAGTVTNLTDFGAFVELEPGVEGLVHISELADRRVERVAEVLNPGEVKTFRIKSLDPRTRKLSLSLREPRKEELEAQQGKYSEKEKQRMARKPKVDKDSLRGGMDLGGPGGVGLGGLKWDDLK